MLPTNRADLLALLHDLRDGRTTVDAVQSRIIAALREQPFEDLGFAKIDHHRSLRQGFPEVVLGLGKTPDQIAAIALQIARRGNPLLVTRADEAASHAVRTVVPNAEYHQLARCITVKGDVVPGNGTIALCTAGTSDQPVAEEAAVTAEILGNTVDRMYDVGVAGIHRVLAQRERLESARVVIVVAGMEGALPSVVAGMVGVPVIAVPTSIGYGASFGGVAALLGMLNSCANGVSVVNIDNGYGAGCIASMINHL
ncbi:MAG TPA: nickel pincer cofactor biosynthesis protein LarB [Vicinamibacterales bacterium]|nr:nickel pincer cofactor biosynthesis protein LarB [Vicinamibacterales bacterium]